MELSGVALRQLPCFSSRIVNSSEFRDKGHLQCYNYYHGEARFVRCGPSSLSGIKKEKESAMSKKKLKLLKGLSKDLSVFFQIDPDNSQAKLVAEAAQELIKELQELRAKEKELKRNKKQEKAKLKAEARINYQCQSSTSECSDSECDSNLRNGVVQPVLVELQQQLEAIGHDTSSNLSKAQAKRIEVCMGNKCKKSGGAALLEAFESVVGVEGAVVGCKCMGKCRDGPNVRVNAAHDPITTPPNSYPLCIGVGLEDVGVIVANYFQDKDKHLGLAPAS